MGSDLSTSLSARNKKCAIYGNGQRTSSVDNVLKCALLFLSCPPESRKGPLISLSVLPGFSSGTGQVGFWKPLERPGW